MVSLPQDLAADGSQYICTLLDSFSLTGPNGKSFSDFSRSKTRLFSFFLLLASCFLRLSSVSSVCSSLCRKTPVAGVSCAGHESLGSAGEYEGGHFHDIALNMGFFFHHCHRSVSCHCCTPLLPFPTHVVLAMGADSSRAFAGRCVCQFQCSSFPCRTARVAIATVH